MANEQITNVDPRIQRPLIVEYEYVKFLREPKYGQEYGARSIFLNCRVFGISGCTEAWPTFTTLNPKQLFAIALRRAKGYWLTRRGSA